MASSAVASYEGGEFPSIRDLWQNKRITDFSRIQRQCHKSIYFALNVEGKEGQERGITNIGLALVRGLVGGGKQADSPTDLTKMVQEYGVDGYDLRRSIRSRHDWNYERSSIAKSRHIDKGERHIHKGEIDNTINEILESARLTSMASIPYCLADFNRESDTNGKSGARFVMVVLGGGHSEFDAIASTIPSVIPYISHWFDLNDLVASMSATPMQTNPFSLRDTMLSLGFSLEHVPKIWGGRPAGIDAVRMIGVLTELCSRPASEKVVLSHHYIGERSRRKLWEVRPKPHENFPFTTKLTTAENVMPPSLQYGQKLLDRVRVDCKGIEPTAVAVCPPSCGKKPKSHAWVCFADRCDAERFVREWNGKQFDGQVLQVEAHLLHDAENNAETNG